MQIETNREQRGGRRVLALSAIFALFLGTGVLVRAGANERAGADATAVAHGRRESVYAKRLAWGRPKQVATSTSAETTLPKIATAAPTSTAAPTTIPPTTAPKPAVIAAPAPTTTVTTTTAPPAVVPASRPSPVGPSLSVASLGAVPNDNVDDSAAIQRAIDSAPEGTNVVFPPGVYLHNNVINVRGRGVKLWGYGAVLEGTNPRAHALILWGNNTEVYGFTLTNHTEGRLLAEEHSGISLHLTTGSILRDNTVVGASAAGILIWGAQDYKILANTVVDTKADGIHSFGGARNGLIEGNVLRNVGDDCFAVVSYINDRSLVSNITIRNNSCVGGKARGISVVGGTDILITGNMIQASAAAGILLVSEESYQTYAAKRVRVIGNNLVGVNTNPNIYHGGIFVEGRGGQATLQDGSVVSLLVEDILVMNNTVSNTVVGHAHLAANGPDSRRVNFIGNVVSGSKAPLHMNLAGPDYNVVGNVSNGVRMADHVGDPAILP
jgi:parallel beta-helix repeat protein